MRSEHPKTHRRLALALISLSLVAPTLAQDTGTAPTLAERFATWKLEAAVGLPGPEQLKALEKIIADAEAIAAGDGDDDVKDAAATLAASATSTLLARRIDARGQELGEIAASVQALKGRTNDLQLRSEVEAALERGDSKLLQKLGDYAIPPLRDLALRTSGIPAKEGSISALGMLNYLAPGAALSVIVQLLESESELTRVEAFRQSARAFNRSDTSVWNREGKSGWSLVNPRWAKIPLQALNEANLASETLGALLDALADKGHLPREAREVATRLANEGHLSLNARVVAPDGLWFYEHLLEHGEGRIREGVMRQLRWSPFRRLALDPTYWRSEAEQGIVAKTVLEGGTYAWTDASRTETVIEPFLPEPSKALKAAFKALALSEFPNVAQAAIKNARKRIEETGSLPLGVSTLLEVAKAAPTAERKRQLQGLVRGIPEAERLSSLSALVLETVEAREEGERFQEAMQPFYDLASYGLPGSDAFWSLAEDLGQYLRPKDVGEWVNWTNIVNRRVEQGTLDAAPMLDWISRHGSQARWPDHIQTETSSLRQPWLTALLDDERLRFLIEIAPEVLDADGRHVHNLVGQGFLQGQDTLKAAILDPRATDALVVRASQYLMKTTKKPLDDRLVAPFARAYFRYNPHPNHSVSPFPWMGAAQQEQLYSLWLSDEAVPDSFLLALSPRLPEENQARLVPSILKRFPRAEWATLDGPRFDLLATAATFAVEQSKTDLHPLLTGDLSEAAHVYDSIARGIKWKRFPALQPLAIRVLMESDPRSLAWDEAIQAVGGYFNEASASALLEAAKRASTAGRRQQAMEALREITEWRETARVWSVASDAQLQRAEAIAELVALIEDPAQSIEVRAASIRGLGLLAAAEQLPLIVRSLSSKTPEIQEAARKALARLEEEADKQER